MNTILCMAGWNLLMPRWDKSDEGPDALGITMVQNIPPQFRIVRLNHCRTKVFAAGHGIAERSCKGSVHG